MKNIILIAIDTQRPDHLGCYGYDRATSPCLDAFAAEGVAFDACWSASNFTAAAFTSLFTGLYPNHHGVFDFRSRVRTSPVLDCLRASGARTSGVVTFHFFQRVLGHIWEDIETITDTRSASYAKNLPAVVSDAAVEWLETNGKNGPFALFLHYDGPHLPYRLPDEYARFFGDAPESAVNPEVRRVFFPQDVESWGAAEEGGLFKTVTAIDRGLRRLDAPTRQWFVDRYDDSVRYNDAQIGRVLDAISDLDLTAETLVAVISDHGEELLDHGHLTHGGIHLYEDTIRTVGLVRGPGLPRGRRVARPVSHVQLWPWLLGLAGARQLPGAWTGIDLLDGTTQSPVFCIGEFKVAVRRGDRKLIRCRVIPEHRRLKRLRMWLKMAVMRELGDELYDLAADPHEQVNLKSDRVARKELSALLAAHLESAAQDLGLSGKSDLADDERARIEKEMRDLGYM